MKLRNKKTGEIAVFGEGIVDLNQIGCKNVSEMIESGWEDVPEDIGKYWFIDENCGLFVDFDNDTAMDRSRKSMGNYFETKEEAEKAVEKLKAWKRLKDRGLRFKTWGWEKHSGKDFTIWFTIDDYYSSTKDLNLLFGGEE